MMHLILTKCPDFISQLSLSFDYCDIIKFKEEIENPSLNTLVKHGLIRSNYSYLENIPEKPCFGFRALARQNSKISTVLDENLMRYMKITSYDYINSLYKELS